MALAMSRPWKHPKTGVYWLRKGISEALREAVGKREEKLSLHTKDPVEAKLRHAEALAGIENVGPTCARDRSLRPSAKLINLRVRRTTIGSLGIETIRASRRSGRWRGRSTIRPSSSSEIPRLRFSLRDDDFGRTAASRCLSDGADVFPMG
jgi:hypothetical protein